MELILSMLGAVMSGGIIYIISHYLLTHKESPWTYPRLHKCRCGGKPQVNMCPYISKDGQYCKYEDGKVIPLEKGE